MKRPPIGGGAALGRVSRAYDSGAFDSTGGGESQPCEDEAVNGRNALNTGHSPDARRTGNIDPLLPFEVGPMNGR
jgi:hypothetical protein